MLKRVCILGSTGSIGRNALRIIERFPDKFKVVGLAANTNVRLLAEQAHMFKPAAVAIGRDSKGADLKKAMTYKARRYCGEGAFEDIISSTKADIVLIAIAGSASIAPTYRAVSLGRTVALASKEAMVSAGAIIMAKAKASGSAIIPVDSEHSAIFQCLRGEDTSRVRRMYLTGSGGPFLDTPKRMLSKMSPRQALRHPRWKMGRKISVDSATLMNKGLEAIEARWLFDMPVEAIKVVVHPQAVIHSMVEFIDGSILAQMGVTDMRLPIQYAFSFPERWNGGLKPLDLQTCGSLTFRDPDRGKFPCLELAYCAARKGGSVPAVLNAANEAAVEKFLDGKILFTDIPKAIEGVMSRHRRKASPTIKDILAIDRWAKEEVMKSWV